MFFKYLLIGFIFYVLYKFIFGFVLPVYRTTKQVKTQFKDMQQKMQDQFNNFTGSDNSATQTTVPNKPTAVKSKDYIDFEEVS